MSYSYLIRQWRTARKQDVPARRFITEADLLRLSDGRTLTGEQLIDEYLGQLREAVGTNEKGHDYAITLLNMPVAVMAKALTFAAAIAEADLADDGVETEPHVTIKYGLRDDALPLIMEIAAGYAPIRLGFGAVTLFERDEYDVVKVDVESEKLRQLHADFAALLPNNEDFPEYNPHLTIAYLKPGMGKKYVGDGPLMGQSVVVDTVQFGTSDGRKVAVSLRNAAVTTKETALSRFLNGRIDRQAANERDRAILIRRMAQAAGIEAGTVNQILRGDIERPPDERLRSFARVLGVSFAELRSLVAERAEKETAVLPESTFIAYKGGDGRHRWVMISSNSYQDRDGEWATQAAQEADVEHMNATGRYGTLDWWHTKLKTAGGRLVPLDIGDCTHAIMIGRFRLEGGTFRDEAVGASFAASKERLGGSLEFLYPQGEPIEGQYQRMFTIRRSVLPADAASNSLTGFVTGQKEQQDMSKKTTYERLKAMAAENGVDAVLQAIAGVSELDGAAKGLRLVAKSKGAGKRDFGALADLTDADLDALATDIIALKEHRERQPDDDSESSGFDMDTFTEAVTKAVTAGIQGPLDEMTALLTSRTKEQVEADRKATELETQIKQLNDELVELKAGPKATKESLLNGYRPTHHNPTIPGQPATPEQGRDGFEMIANKAVNL